MLGVYPLGTRLAVPPLRQLDTSRATLGFSATFSTLTRPGIPAQGRSGLRWHVSPPCHLGIGGLRQATRAPTSYLFLCVQALENRSLSISFSRATTSLNFPFSPKGPTSVVRFASGTAIFAPVNKFMLFEAPAFKVLLGQLDSSSSSLN